MEWSEEKVKKLKIALKVYGPQWRKIKDEIGHIGHINSICFKAY